MSISKWVRFGTRFSGAWLTVLLCWLAPVQAAYAIFDQSGSFPFIVSMEAENFHSNTPNSPHAWVELTSPPAGASGGGAMEASPNTGVNNNDNFLAASPRLDFQVNFATTGTHWIRVRGIGATFNDDSIHVGLNGQAVSTADDLHMATGSSYEWSTVNRRINIPSTGVHTITVWMREDGTVLDKIVLSTDSALSLSGTGPAESPQNGGGGNQSPVAQNDSFVVTQDSADNELAVLANNGNGADFDPDGDPLQVVSTGSPNQGGTAVPNAAGDRVLYSPASGFTGTETFSYTIDDGSGGTDSATVTVSVSSTGGGGGGPFQQSGGGDNIVSMEAENFHSNTPNSPHAWLELTSPPAGASGGGAMEAAPNNGTNNDNNFLSASPRLEFQVNFVTTGTHWIRVRGIGGTPVDDSIHVGLNGQAVSTADDLHMQTGSDYEWSTVNRRLNIPSTGVHTITVWMREDGTILDKIVLSRNASLSLSGTGPAESPQNGGGGNQEPVAENDSFVVAQDTTGNSLAVLANNGNGADSDPDGDPLEVVSAGTPNQGGTAIPNAAGDRVLYTPAPGFTGTETFTYTIEDGNGGSDTATVTMSVSSTGGGGGGPFEQASGGDNIVSMEAENFHTNTPNSPHAWLELTSPPAGASGGGAMEAAPNNGTNNNDNFLSASPRLDFQVDFATTGTHWIRVRGIGATFTDDSIHVGLNGQAVSSADDLHMATGSSYQWSTVNRTIFIPSTGIHTISVWMREDGVILDKVVLSTNASLPLSGTGPAESPRSGGCGSAPSVSLTSPAADHIQTSSSLTVSADACLDPGVHSGWGVRFQVVEEGPGADSYEQFDMSAPFEVTFNGLDKDEHTVTATLVNSSQVPQGGANSEDTVTDVGVGDIYLAIGDSITWGTGDDISSDNTSADGRSASRGYPPILADLLTVREAYPNAVINEGVGGDTAADGLAILPGILSTHLDAQRVVAKFGMNDAGGMLPVPSGEGLSPGNPGYAGSFKDTMQQIIDLINGAGKEAILVKVNIALAPRAASPPAEYYPDPNTGARSVQIQAYNRVLDELRAIPGNAISIAIPDLYAWSAANYSTEYADAIHPNGVGYQSMAAEILVVIP